MKKSSWLILFTLVMSTMITLSANNWMSMWIGLEINLMSFVPMILSKNNKSSSESAMIYFLVQSMSSVSMMMMIMMKMYSLLNSMSIMNTTIMICLFMKMGVAPFHLWLPEIMAKMSWKKCIILMTWQKLAPMMMLSNLSNNSIMNMAILSCILIGSLGGINQTSLRKMMGYSSINHLGWMLAINKSMNMWMIYFIIYSLLSSMICYNFMKYKMYFMNQLSMINLSKMEKINMFFMMLSMGGMPPFIGFLPKWITIQYMINQKEIFMMIIMIMFSLITLLYYSRIMINMIISSSMTIKWSMGSSKLSTLYFIMMNLSLPLILVMNMF
uniref:NADH dehydrogenase subunit 2 n=1 Tax=Gonopsimorpha nigrosignata TaxID=3021792 RepID=UPI0023AAE60C|nr:NADH dehydrogenase subunit 2 [Gonopsimorpha nigrosignata]WCB99302.1 NADH dehydrogenase subunit 2 [Gonopsimorpha nigrosignata]